jgi:hypothetical protein
MIDCLLVLFVVDGVENRARYYERVSTFVSVYRVYSVGIDDVLMWIEETVSD